MRRLLLLAPLLPFVVGCGAVVQLPEERAADAAQDVAVEAGGKLYGQRPRSAAEVGRSAAGIDGVEVLRVTGTSTHDDGIEVIIRTSGSAYGDRLDSQKIVVRRCFVLRVSSGTERGGTPHGVDCPDGPPLAFAPPPEPPPLPAGQLRAQLPRVPQNGRVEAAEVRRAVAALDMDPAVRTEMKEDGGRVGLLLSVEGNGSDPQSCVLARVEPGSTDVWTPPRAQRMPGEGGCTVGNALDPLPAPH
ncbi:translation initiation factor IF-2 [Streptomyces zhihengii]